jgi:H/ACA ribonucleoprotein complex subunit 1
MVKEFQESRGGNFQRGSFGGRGGSRGRGGSFNNNRGGFDHGPPSYVIPYGTFLHKSENHFVVKCTDMSRFPKFNRGVYLENKSKVGSVDEILGPVNAFYFSVKPAEGVNPSSFKEGQVFYMSPEDLLSTDRFTKPQAPRPKGPPRQFGAGGGRPQQGNRGGSFNGRGRGAPRGAPRGRGGSFRGRG